MRNTRIHGARGYFEQGTQQGSGLVHIRHIPVRVARGALSLHECRSLLNLQPDPESEAAAARGLGRGGTRPDRAPDGARSEQALWQLETRQYRHTQTLFLVDSRL